MCHLFLGLPLLALPVFWLLPLPAAVAVYGVTLAVALTVYGYAMKAMQVPRMSGGERMLGTHGRVVRVDGQRAMLLVGGELWSAEAPEQSLALGDAVIIEAIDGLTLRARKCREAW
jgi:inner membrane protein